MKRIKYLLILLFLFFPFNILADDYPQGDVNGDSEVTVKDYILIRKHILNNPKLTGEELTRADVDGDNDITVSDYIIIRKIILGLYVPSPSPSLAPNITPSPRPTPTATPKPTPSPSPTTIPVKMVNHDQRNKAIIEYLKSPTTVKVDTIYNKYNCGKELACDKPSDYSSSISGKVNIYNYDEKTKEKTLITSVKSDDIRYYLIPGKSYYIESTTDTSNIQIVKINGSLRMINASLSNFRDLGGWKADNGTILYGKLFRSANTNNLTSLSQLKSLGINRVVDLRPDSEINSSSAVESIRKRVPVTYYSTGQNVRDAIETIMKSVVNDKKNVLFNCNYGRDRTGTIAYILEGILGVSLEDRKTDFELTYFYSPKRTRYDSSLESLINEFKKYKKVDYEQERFINWYLSTSKDKNKDLKLINNFRKKLIDGKPTEYKLVNGVLTKV